MDLEDRVETREHAYVGGTHHDERHSGKSEVRAAPYKKSATGRARRADLTNLGRPSIRASQASMSAPVTAPIPWAVTSTDVPPAPLWNSSIATAGTRAMNGEPINATTAMSVIGLRQPGNRAAILAPSFRRSTIPAPVALSCSGSRTNTSAITTAPNEMALAVKAQPADPSDESDPCQGRADHPAEVELRRRERDRCEEVLLVDEVGEHRLVGREPDRGRRPTEEGDEGQEPGDLVTAEGERGETRCKGRLGQSRDDQPSPAIETVRECASERGEEAVREEAGRSDQTGPARLVGLRRDHHPESDDLHPGAHVRDESSRPDECEVPARQEVGATPGARSSEAIRKHELRDERPQPGWPQEAGPHLDRGPNRS